MLASLTFHLDVFRTALVCRSQTALCDVYVPLQTECDTDHSQPQIQALAIVELPYLDLRSKAQLLFFLAVQSDLHRQGWRRAVRMLFI